MFHAEKSAHGVGCVAHASHDTLESQGRRITSCREFEASLGKTVRPPLYNNNNKKIDMVARVCRPGYFRN